MVFFLSIQNSYHELELALFQADRLIDVQKTHKIYASRDFVTLIDHLLTHNGRTLNEIAFIAVNQGPGPFTTLRTVIASVNGLSFARTIPLIGIDGLAACLAEYYDPNYPATVVLLNAFSQDVYFAIQHPQKKKVATGYNNIHAVLETLHTLPAIQQPIRFLGNATIMYQELIQESLGAQAFIPDPIPQTCSVKQIGIMGWDTWNKKEGITNQVLPLYLKKALTTQMNQKKNSYKFG